MNRALCRGLAIVFLVLVPCLEAAAQSQHEMNEEARARFEKADAELNRIYKKLAATVDEDGRAKLKAAQRAWVAFRDAAAEFQADREARGGSMEPMIYSGAAAELTRARIRDLEKMLQGSR